MTLSLYHVSDTAITTLCTYSIVFAANANMNPVRVEDFTEHVDMLKSNMCEQFQTDYKSLESETEYTFHAAKLAVNVNKNRYKNILPCM